MFRKPDVERLLATAVGPAPWYWRTFPTIDSSAGRFVWRLEELPNGNGERVVLCAESEPSQPLLALAKYTRAFALPPNLLGLWFDDGRLIRVVAIDVDNLSSLHIDCDSTCPQSPAHGYLIEGAPIGEFWVSRDLEPGDHYIDLPPCFAALNGLMLLGKYAKVQEPACSAIFEIRAGKTPGSHRVYVFPQEWFTRDAFDLGYQWITRVARDPESGRIVGEGFRLNSFVLTDDGCHLDHWVA